ncbi:Gfo/Idh/MocA family protein [Psychrobacillus soli]|uniref:Gfo/Idh/MocA family oxidoreductase n=1 Tax=Psychrobacillus soli TaxID=1543965 RepID=A0A544TDL0_9BACI|nr:Gfo/Idh/MocA family oxidoreductase [Psychrobacillus soli]TQR15532.1 Gfo/Idh/MocA family oxidoreductase [Psychrobacillus soli]
MKTLGVGVIGLGAIAQIHFEAIKKCEQLKLTGIYARKQDQARSEAEKWGCVAFQSPDELMANPNVDIVVLLTPPGIHKELINKAIHYNKHILLEKPIGTYLKDIEEYIQAASEKNLSFSVVSQHRFDNASQLVKEKIERGYIGEIVGANCSVNWYRDTDYYQGWRTKQELAGGGVLAIQGIHTIDLMLWFLGEVESVKGYVTNRLHKDIGVEDTAMATVKFANGSLGSISASTSSYPGFPARLELLGTNGSITIEGDRLVFYQSNLDENPPIVQVKSAKTTDSPSDVSIEPFVTQYEDVIRSIEQSKEPLVSGEEAFKAYRLVAAIYKSSETGLEINLKEVSACLTK